MCPRWLIHVCVCVQTDGKAEGAESCAFWARVLELGDFAGYSAEGA